ncbi:hypothetical protein [Fluviispira multicolorata]|uniref:Uncharacterized protein n=1 Tax=Fluviispira multicolorata TaxID=2654512 RepID=A0A833JF66_9BACT|nr:hypothetical protein [Fluviispira multicolorata]KAB8033576.1 hypothetical protein GCL57_02385 [Fluviispira multicolorata]
MKNLFCGVILLCFPFSLCFADEGVYNREYLQPIILDYFGTPVKFCNTYSLGTVDNSNSSTNDGFLIAKISFFGLTKYLARTIYESKRAAGYIQFISVKNIPCDHEVRENDLLFINLKNAEQSNSYYVKMDDDGFYFPLAQKENSSNKDHIFQFINSKKNYAKSSYTLQYISSNSMTFLTCQGLNYCESTEFPSKALLIRFLPVKSTSREKAIISNY